jgi:hypothetical protein
MRYGHSNTSSAFFQIYPHKVAVTSLPTLWERGTRQHKRYVHSTSPLLLLPLCPNQKSNVTDFSATRKRFRLTARNVKHGKRIIRKREEKRKQKNLDLGNFFILATHHPTKMSYWVLMGTGRKYGNPVMVVVVAGIFLFWGSESAGVVIVRSPGC